MKMIEEYKGIPETEDEVHDQITAIDDHRGIPDEGIKLLIDMEVHNEIAVIEDHKDYQDIPEGVKRKSYSKKGSPTYYKSLVRKYCKFIVNDKPEPFFWEVGSFVEDRRRPKGTSHKDFRALKTCQNKACLVKPSYKKSELDMTVKYI